MSNFPAISLILTLLIIGKTLLVTLTGRLFGISTIAAVRTGLLLAPGGEFAFVAFGEAVNQVWPLLFSMECTCYFLSFLMFSLVSHKIFFLTTEFVTVISVIFIRHRCYAALRKTHGEYFAGSSIASTIVIIIFSGWYFNGYDTIFSCWRAVLSI